MTPAGSFLLGTALYVIGHAVVYLAVLRHLRSFRRERSIFLYHLVAFGILLLAAALAWLAVPAAPMITAGIGALALHTIYSMSFLELWSLSQISYSIALLDAIGAEPGVSMATLTRRFADTGDEKKRSRLSSLRGFRLITTDDGNAALTSSGRVVAAALSALRRISNFQRTG